MRRGIRKMSINQQRSKPSNLANKPVMFGKLEELLTKDSNDLLLSLLCPRLGFAERLAQSRAGDPMIRLLLKVILKICQCQQTEGCLLQILGLVVNSCFMKQVLSEFLSNYPDQDTILEILHVLEELTKRLPTKSLPIVTIRLEQIQIALTHWTDLKYEIVDCISEAVERLGNSLSDIRRNINLGYLIEDQIDHAVIQNNGESFRRMSIIPTHSEMQSTRCELLNKNVIFGKYEDVSEYLDVQFRLLREDLIRPLREGFEKLSEIKQSGRKLTRHNTDLKIYNEVRIISPTFDRREISHRVKFDVKHLKKIRWETSKRLRLGSLVCLFDEKFNTAPVLFATVVDRDINKLKIGEIGLHFEGTSGSKYCHLELGDVYSMIESPSYFPAYKPVLRSLQLITETSLPFSEYILNHHDKNVPIKPPLYLTNAQHSYDFSRFMMDHSRKTCTGQWPTAEQLHLDDSQYNALKHGLTKEPLYLRNAQHSYDFSRIMMDHSKKICTDSPNFSTWPTAEQLHLDDSQYNALKCGLTKELAIIQGPPGTGKTLIGQKIVEVLLANETVWNPVNQKAPILIVCYTNHALDQFLEGILCSKLIDSRVGSHRLIRIGGRSKSEMLKPFNLSEIKNQEYERRQRAIANQSNRKRRRRRGTYYGNAFAAARYPHKNKMNSLREKILKLMDFIESSRKEIIIEYKLKDYMSRDHVTSLLQYKQGRMSILLHWLMNKRRPYNSHRNKKVGVEDCGDFILEENDRNLITVKKLRMDNASFRSTMAQAEVMHCLNVWKLSQINRWRLYNFWVAELVKDLVQTLNALCREYDAHQTIFDEIMQEENYSLISNSKIIGMTTSGSAKHRQLLQRIKPRIIIVEEAAEVFEAHIVTCLSASCEHLILIGDHQQLRPSPTNYELGRKFKLDISLFERFVVNHMQCARLDVQHRMRPEISELIVPHIYKELKNAHSVRKFEVIHGVMGNVLFINHTVEEEYAVEGQSYSNEHEARFLSALCLYFLNIGYKAEQITVLATYTGQIRVLQKYLPKHTYANVCITSVDNYQGQENDIILLSLVRSNKKGKIGFLRKSNRVCVALSRAKKGFFIIGNAFLLTECCKLWSDILDSMRRKNRVVERLQLGCHVHQESVYSVASEEEFRNVPSTGCSLPCGKVLNCGHVCDLLCHPFDTNHEEYRCRKQCTKLCSFGHRCIKPCSEKCGNCEVLVEKSLSLCQHKVKLPCCIHEANYQCQKPCKNKCKILSHLCIKKCGEPCGDCNVQVKRILPICGHPKYTPCQVLEKIQGDIILSSEEGKISLPLCTPQDYKFEDDFSLDIEIQSYMPGSPTWPCPLSLLPYLSTYSPCSLTNTPCSPTNTPCSSTNIPCSPSNTPCLPTNMPWSPSNTSCSTTNTPCSPTNTPLNIPWSPSNASCLPTNMPCSSTNMPLSPTNIPWSPSNTACSPSNTSCSPINSPCSATNTPCSPLNMPWSPSNTSCLPTNMPCSPAIMPWSPFNTPCSQSYIPSFEVLLADNNEAFKHKELIKKFNQCLMPCNRFCKTGEILHPCRKLCWEDCGSCLTQVLKVLPKCHHMQQVSCYKLPEEVICNALCERNLQCGHKCKELCRAACTAVCTEIVTNILLPCLHTDAIQCFEIVDSKDDQSKHDVGFRLHLNNTIPYSEKHLFELFDQKYTMMRPIQCRNECNAEINCGHKCKERCFVCLSQSKHNVCIEPCNKTLPFCSHACAQKCGKPCSPCYLVCQNSCRHEKCTHICSKSCKPCDKPCDWKCAHQKCKLTCSEPCTREGCNEPCELQLECSHPCMGLCGEPCLDICIHCDAEQFEEIEQEFPECVISETTRYIQLLPCCHIFPVEYLDRYVKKRKKFSEVNMKSYLTICCPIDLCGEEVNVCPRFNAQTKRLKSSQINAKFKIAQEMISITEALSQWAEITGNKFSLVNDQLGGITLVKLCRNLKIRAIYLWNKCQSLVSTIRMNEETVSACQMFDDIKMDFLECMKNEDESRIAGKVVELGRIYIILYARLMSPRIIAFPPLYAFNKSQTDFSFNSSWKVCTNARKMWYTIQSFSKQLKMSLHGRSKDRKNVVDFTSFLDAPLKSESHLSNWISCTKGHAYVHDGCTLPTDDAEMDANCTSCHSISRFMWDALSPEKLVAIAQECSSGHERQHPVSPDVIIEMNVFGECFVIADHSLIQDRNTVTKKSRSRSIEKDLRSKIISIKRRRSEIISKSYHSHDGHSYNKSHTYNRHVFNTRSAHDSHSSNMGRSRANHYSNDWQSQGRYSSYSRRSHDSNSSNQSQSRDQHSSNNRQTHFSNSFNDSSNNNRQSRIRNRTDRYSPKVGRRRIMDFRHYTQKSRHCEHSQIIDFRESHQSQSPQDSRDCAERFQSNRWETTSINKELNHRSNATINSNNNKRRREDSQECHRGSQWSRGVSRESHGNSEKRNGESQERYKPEREENTRERHEESKRRRLLYSEPDARGFSSTNQMGHNYQENNNHDNYHSNYKERAVSSTNRAGRNYQDLDAVCSEDNKYVMEHLLRFEDDLL